MRYISTRPAFGNHAITLLYINHDDIKTDRIEVGVKWLRIVTNGGCGIGGMRTCITQTTVLLYTNHSMMQKKRELQKDGEKRFI
jgi:hypothetical protein